MIVVSSTRNALVRHWNKLQLDHVYRYEQGRYLVDGVKMTEELMDIACSGLGESNLMNISRLVVSKSFAQEDRSGIIKKYNVFASRASKDDNIYILDDWIMNKITNSNSEGVFMETCFKSMPFVIKCDNSSNGSIFSPSNMKKRQKRLLILDGIRDPGNLGSILRSALAFHWHNVVSIAPCVDYYHPNVIRASRHAQIWLNLGICNVSSVDSMMRSLIELQSTSCGNSNSIAWVVADKPNPPYTTGSLKSQETILIDSDFKNIKNILAIPHLALILGSESHGPVHFLDKPHPTKTIKLSLDISRRLESLNVASSASILMHALQDKCNLCN